MKKLNFVLGMVLILAIISCTQNNSNQQTAPSEEITTEAQVTTYQFNVQGMTCTGCEQTVQKSVSALPGVSEVLASHTDSIATVTFDMSKTTAEEISSAINKKGYEVTGFNPSTE